MVIDKKEPFPKRPRLKDFDYTGTNAYFITVWTKDHRTFFKEEEVVKDVVDILNETSISEKFKVLAYCFMPDHLHLLVIGQDDRSNAKKFVSFFKKKWILV